MTELVLRNLAESDETAFRDAIAAFETVDPEWSFAFDFEGVTDFSTYVRRLLAWEKGEQLNPRHVPNTFLVALVGPDIVGRVSIRHQLNEFLLRIGGHVGYGVVPKHRGKGYATEMLRQALPVCRRVGIDRVLLTCDETNVASWKVIEANGGVLEARVEDPSLAEPKRRYWITLARPK